MEEEHFQHCEFVNIEDYELFLAGLRRLSATFQTDYARNYITLIWLACGLHSFKINNSIERAVLIFPEHDLKMSFFENGVVDVQLL